MIMALVGWWPLSAPKKTYIHGIVKGYIKNQITWTENYFAGGSNPGEIGIAGSDFQDLDGRTRLIGSINSGLASPDATGKQLYVMHTYDTLSVRGLTRYGSSADHFVAVEYDNSQWYYYNNESRSTFTPIETDLIVAKFVSGMSNLEDYFIDVEDHSFFHNDASNNGATLTTGGPFGSYYSFDSAEDDYINSNVQCNEIFVDDQDFSISCWAKIDSYPTSSAEQGAVLSCSEFYSLTEAGGFAIGIQQNNIVMVLGEEDTTLQQPMDNTDFPIGVWMCLVMVFNGTGSYFYKDGVLMGSSTRLTTWQTNSYNIFFGRGTQGGWRNTINCGLSNVKIYNHALSLNEIKDLANCKVLHYTCNQFQEPTTNYISNGNASNGLTDWSYSGSNIDVVDVDWSSSGKAFLIESADDNTAVINQGFTVNEGETYTVSCKFKITEIIYDRFTIFIKYYSNGSWVQNNGIYNSTEITDVISITSTFTIPTGIDQVKFNPEFYVTDQGSALVSDIQIEKKDHATPFVDGSRTAKVYDCSGLDNHADLAESTTPKWVEGGPVGSGYYVFDGDRYFSRTKIFNDNINQSWTVCGWVYVPDNSIGSMYLISGFNSGCRITHASTCKALLYINSSDNDSYTYSDITIPENEWFHIAYVLNTNTQRCQIYINGILHGTSTNYSETDIPSGFGSTMSIGTNLEGYISDIRVYAKDLSSNDILDLYQSGACIDKNKNLSCNEIIENHNLIGDASFNEATAGDYNAGNDFSEWHVDVGTAHITTDSTVPSPNGTRVVNFDGDGTYHRIRSKTSFNLVPGEKIYGQCLYKPETGAKPYFGIVFNSGYTYFTVNRADLILLDGWKLWRGEINVPTGVSSGQVWCFNYEDNTGALSFKDFKISRTQINDARFEIGGRNSDNFTLTDNIKKSSILKIKELNNTGPTSGLVGWWPLNGDTKDKTMNRNDGTNNGATIVQGLGGKQAYEFDGISQYIDSNYDLSWNNTNSVSISFWIKPATIDIYDKGIIGKISTGYEWSIYQYYEDIKLVYWNNSGGHTNGMDCSAANILNVGQWTHVIYTWNKTTSKFYINGDLKTTHIATDSSINQNRTNNVMFGGHTYTWGDNYFTGSLLDIRFYNRVLSQQEISWLFDMYNPNKNIGMEIYNNNIIYAGSFKEGY
jgi:hypothetical protein